MKKINVGKLELKQKGVIFDFYQQKISLDDKTIFYDVIKHNGAVGILLVDGEDFVLVEQFRYPLQKNIIEIVAGKIEPEEQDFTLSALREVREELGVEVENLQYLEQVMPSGGIYSEVIHLYCASVKNYNLATNFDQFEDVKIRKINKQVALDMVFSNQICDAKTVYAIMRYFNDWKTN